MQSRTEAPSGGLRQGRDGSFRRGARVATFSVHTAARHSELDRASADFSPGWVNEFIDANKRLVHPLVPDDRLPVRPDPFFLPPMACQNNFAQSNHRWKTSRSIG
jgi:hypothetical protein